MNKEIAMKWVQALRSGEYKKGRDFLKNSNDKFCCLGVLCDLHAKETNTEWDYKNSKITSTPVYFGEDESLPDEVKKWSSSTSCDPYIIIDDNCYRLSYLNDCKNLSFNEIADLIEAQYENL